jgi:hypothetical protein
MDYASAPEYLRSADLHNVGSGNESFFSAPLENTAEFVSNIPNFAISSVASGINSIYNSGVVAGNFFGLTDATENDLQTTLSGFDSNLGSYYEANKQLADTVGFIATSFVPGMAGVKLAQTGQRVLSGALKTGKVGATLAESTGLALTSTRTGLSLTEIAGQSLAQSGQTFTLMNAGVLKAIGGGVGQATLESLAFESMVAATMFRSPILEDMDIKDIGANLLTGAALGGAIGGLINAAGVYGGIKKVLTAADLEQKKFTLRNSQFGLEKSPESRILVGASDLAATPQALNSGETALRNSRIIAIEQERRVAIHDLTKGDTELGNFLADSTIGMEADKIVKAYQGVREIMRPGTLVSAGEGKTAGYIRLHGENAGEVTFDSLSPNKLSLADKLAKREKVDEFVKAQRFSEKAPWNPVTAGSIDVVEARYIWAEKFAKYADGMTIHPGDIALQEGALKNRLASVVIDDGIHSYTITNLDDLANEVLRNKQALVNGFSKSKKSAWGLGVETPGTKFNKTEVATITSDEIARVANVPLKAIESEELTLATMNARTTERAAYAEMRRVKKLSGEADLDYVPRHAAVVYDTAAISANGDTVTSLIYIKHQQKLQQQATDKAVAQIAGEDLSGRMFYPGDKAILESNRYGSGAGLVTFSNGSYGSLASWSESVGKVAADLQAKLKTNTSAIMDSTALKLRVDQAAAIEFDKIRNLVASTTETYILNPAGDGLIAARLQEFRDLTKAGKKGVEVPTLRGGAPDEIKFISPTTGDAVVAHIEANGHRVSGHRALQSSVGLENSRNPNAFYAHKPDPKSMPFFAFVKDETVTGAGMGHTSMLHAATAQELDDMIKMARERTGFTVYTKADAEEFYKAQKSYEFDRTLHENYIDSSLKSAGINNQFFPKTDPQKIVDEWTTWHSKQDDILARETIATKFGHEFDQLETLGQQYTNIAGSRYATNQRTIEATALNPYNDYRKTALNISRMNEYPVLSALNKNLEQSVSRVYQKISDTFAATKTVNDLETVNAALQAAGVNHAYKNAAEIILVNHSAPQPYVSKFIRGANAILANTFLRLDPLNALNNAIGSQVLLGSETSSQVRSILKQLEGINVPGTSDSVLSTSKLIGKAQANFLSREKSGMLEMFRENGFMTEISDQYKAMLDDLTLSGAERPVDLDSRLGRALEKVKSWATVGEKITGNKLAEEYNRFVAADVARQISDRAIDAGLMQADGQLAYINTFVNRTQGNIMASQRPLIFQGPIGQAIGLFQTFQFNTMQQLFRGISEGGAKDAAMMMGLQGTIYGLNGLPGFQYINQHIVGTASGNKNHTDAYSTTYGAAGKTAGDWLMYGIPSNLLQTNIYSRGDINPRTLTIIPTAPQDIIAVTAFAKFAGNIKETASKIANGGDFWQSVLQGVEHNGLSRPLAGLAQTLQAADGGKVYSTTKAGDINFVNDFFSLSTLSRLGGGKPLDEALANDEVARSMIYKAKDRERMKAASERFKTNVIDKSGGNVDPAAVHNYMESFVRNGGRQEDFNKNMLNILTKTNSPKANQIMESMKGPYGAHMKSLMGGKLEELNLGESE